MKDRLSKYRDYSISDAVTGIKGFLGSYPGVGPFGSIGGPGTGSLIQGAALSAPVMLYNYWRNRRKGREHDLLGDYVTPGLLGLLAGGALNAPAAISRSAAREHERRRTEDA